MVEEGCQIVPSPGLNSYVLVSYTQHLTLSHAHTFRHHLSHYGHLLVDCTGIPDHGLHPETKVPPQVQDTAGEERAAGKMEDGQSKGIQKSIAKTGIRVLLLSNCRS